MEEQKKTEKNSHLFQPGQSGNPAGRKPDTEADKIRKKAQRELIEDYKNSLIDSLRLISPVLIAKALEGDMTAVKEVNDRALGKTPQAIDVTSDGEQIKAINYIIPSDGNNTEANG